MNQHNQTLEANGFDIINGVYDQPTISSILRAIHQADTSRPTFRRSTDLFAIRRFLHEIPAVLPLLLNDNMRELITTIMGREYFIVKSIFFDKPAGSNWYVSYHQDLTISVDSKQDIPGFGPWTVKTNQFAVQPPLAYLQNIVTLRIHLDVTTTENGALRVIPRSHKKEIFRPENIDWANTTETSCEVPAGGVMLMKPLLLHSSGRTTNEQQRRVIHIELASMELPPALNWAEKIAFQ
ncbi:phytanoyl-CoA dioxygenase family protein [Chitinophaga sp. sic0106]|uniref:phytanoyl-CoA dioxygenase family protein n=1 Tax=Chitinophaga sp. sic0106 TaxID=2854785 RepID=UPI001C491BE2|nr:phytanoyl-CoA dioxygenase family protein [Chitinophaga sp. sic0106]MBV7533781.1 phytanoyl-CoA dioxygenase family protein [Chitinophaga sp. sic0106]